MLLQLGWMEAEKINSSRAHYMRSILTTLSIGVTARSAGVVTVTGGVAAGR